MPTFDFDPPSVQDNFPFRILRCPALGALDAIATCSRLIGTWTHFAQNRTVPCEGQDACSLCAEGFSKRWHAYLSALIPKTLEHILFECTASASEAFRTYQSVHSTLRGCYFRAERPSHKPNGRVIIKCHPADLTGRFLPPEPDVHRLLCHLWNVQYDPNDLGPSCKPIGTDVHTGNGRRRIAKADNRP